MDYTELVIDPRSEAGLRREIGALAASYTPEWRFDPQNPDAGSTIALIWAGQMADNLRRLNQVFEKYHTEFVNFLGLSLLPAYPANGVVVVSLISDTIAGLPLPKGTKLLGRGSGELDDSVVFETTGDVYITSARLTDVLSISGHFGRILPVTGGPEPMRIFPGESLDYQPPEDSAVSLFDFSRPGVERNAALFYHQTVFDPGPGAVIHIRPQAEGANPPAAQLTDAALFRWSYLGEEGLTPFDHVKEEGGEITLSREGESRPLSLDGAPHHLLCVEALGPVQTPVTLTGLRLASSRAACPPEFLCHNDQDLNFARFLPFGDSASLFDECYIGHDKVFSQEGALVTLRFTLSFQEKLVTFTPQQEADALKIIKRKPRSIPFSTATTSPDEVTFDYFNGLGWRRLPCVGDWSALFDGHHPGESALSFRCPDDWRPTVVGGYQQRCIRIRITRADNCYLQPCLHTMPVVENLALSYLYDGTWKLPHRLQTICGTKLSDLTRPILQGEPVNLFRPLPYTSNALYLGFDQRPEGSPVSLLFDVAESVHFQNAPLTFEYSTLGGFRPLKVIDGTENLSVAGTVLFLPPSDMAPMEVEGVDRCWVRLVDADGEYDEPGRHHPLIRAIYPNAVEIQNVETLEEEEFFLTVPGPNMTFPVAAENILSLEVFVNERDRLSQPMMQALLRDRPQDVRAQFNFLGEISAFFVRWTEAESFDASLPTDRHYTVDRMNNTISFGDGVHVMIPTGRDGAAFTVRASCCRGGRGNLPPGSVSTLRGRLLYVDTVYNPIATYAGSNIESLPSAHNRGANLLSGRGRLVSQLDYVREVTAFSSAIAKVKCLAGRDMEGGSDPSLVTVAVMMRDYEDGSYSFSDIKDRLRRQLLARCEATLDPSCLLVAEPVYVSIALTVWAETPDPHSSFELQNLIRDGVNTFLNPLGREGAGGWDIGQLPTSAQLGMLLHALRGPGRVIRFIATARYVDRTGTHERSLDEVQAGPFAIGVRGEHKIYVELAR